MCDTISVSYIQETGLIDSGKQIVLVLVYTHLGFSDTKYIWNN